MDINHRSKKNTVVPDHNRMKYQKGQSILFEGKVAQIIHLTPLFTIKVEDSVICGALHTLVDASN